MATTIDPLLLSVHHSHKARVSSGVRGQSTARTARPTERTFRRRRRVLGSAVVFAIAFGFVAGGAVASDPSQEDLSVPRTVIAKQGDTLWDIARTIVPTGAIGDLVTDMVRLNGSHIEPGQVVRIP
jgi:nucleoid-associated protein YgaU